MHYYYYIRFCARERTCTGYNPCVYILISYNIIKQKEEKKKECVFVYVYNIVYNKRVITRRILSSSRVGIIHTHYTHIGIVHRE